MKKNNYICTPAGSRVGGRVELSICSIVFYLCRDVSIYVDIFHCQKLRNFLTPGKIRQRNDPRIGCYLQRCRNLTATDLESEHNVTAQF